MKLTDRHAQSLLKWCCARADQAGLSFADVSAAPSIPTVYFLIDATHEQVFYIGQSNHLRRRLLTHINDTKKIEAGWEGEIAYFSPGIESTDKRLEIEAHLILTIRPVLNRALFLNTSGRRLTEIRWKRKHEKYLQKGAAA